MLCNIVETITESFNLASITFFLIRSSKNLSSLNNIPDKTKDLERLSQYLSKSFVLFFIQRSINHFQARMFITIGEVNETSN